jgi:hypothetical protein
MRSVGLLQVKKALPLMSIGFNILYSARVLHLGFINGAYSFDVYEPISADQGELKV